MIMYTYIMFFHCRYQSLQRSFHGERSAGRPIPGHPHTQTPLSPIMSANNLSLRAGEAEELSQGMVGPPPKPKRQRDSSKTNRWLFFGRKSKKQILPQGLPGSGDDVLPISPVSSSPPSIDDAMIPPSPTTSLDQSTRSQSVESPRESRSRSSSSRGEEIEEPLPRRVERLEGKLIISDTEITMQYCYYTFKYSTSELHIADLIQ